MEWFWAAVLGGKHLKLDAETLVWPGPPRVNSGQRFESVRLETRVRRYTLFDTLHLSYHEDSFHIWAESYIYEN